MNNNSNLIGTHADSTGANNSNNVSGRLADLSCNNRFIRELVPNIAEPKSSPMLPAGSSLEREWNSSKRQTPGERLELLAKARRFVANQLANTHETYSDDSIVQSARSHGASTALHRTWAADQGGCAGSASNMSLDCDTLYSVRTTTIHSVLPLTYKTIERTAIQVVFKASLGLHEASSFDCSRQRARRPVRESTQITNGI